MLRVANTFSYRGVGVSEPLVFPEGDREPSLLAVAVSGVQDLSVRSGGVVPGGTVGIRAAIGI